MPSAGHPSQSVPFERFHPRVSFPGFLVTNPPVLFLQVPDHPADVVAAARNSVWSWTFRRLSLVHRPNILLEVLPPGEGSLAVSGATRVGLQLCLLVDGTSKSCRHVCKPGSAFVPLHQWVVRNAPGCHWQNRSGHAAEVCAEGGLIP